MEIRWFRKVVSYGDMMRGENTTYKTTLQYNEDGMWYDVETIEECDTY